MLSDTLVERRSKYTRLESIPHKTAAAVRTAARRALALHKASLHTITYDNGREFSDHEGMAQDLDTIIYFAHPYASWEREVNENTNGLILEFFPKHQDLTRVSEQELTAVEENLNHRQRKTLGFRTPHEVFFDTTT